MKRYVNRLVLLSSVGLGCFLTGCGSGAPGTVTTVPTPAASALNGNWLLTGSLPFSASTTSNPTLGIAVSFTVSGTKVVGGATINLPCGAFSSAAPAGVVQGTVAADGSFKLDAAPGLTGPLQLTGTAPPSGATSFSGTYSLTTTGICASTLTGKFNATKIADITGAYTGATTLTFVSGPLFPASKPATLSFSLTQGGVPPGATLSDAAFLTGSVTVQGAGCFSKGVATTAPGGVLGADAVMSFSMDDGSTLNLLAATEDAASARLQVLALTSSGGSCGAMFAGPFELVKQ